MCSNNKNNKASSNVCPILQRLLAMDTCHLVTNSATVKATNYATVIRQKLLLKKQKSFFIWRVQPTGIAVLLALLAFANTLWGDFVHDDIPAIVNNPDVNGASGNVLDAFSNDFWGEPMASVKSHKSYRPLTILVFR